MRWPVNKETQKELYSKKKDNAIESSGQRIQGRHMGMNIQGQKAYANENENITEVVAEHSHTDRTHARHYHGLLEPRSWSQYENRFSLKTTKSVPDCHRHSRR